LREVGRGVGEGVDGCAGGELLKKDYTTQIGPLGWEPGRFKKDSMETQCNHPEKIGRKK